MNLKKIALQLSLRRAKKASVDRSCGGYDKREELTVTTFLIAAYARIHWAKSTFGGDFGHISFPLSNIENVQSANWDPSHG